jgi:hypothetical protein
VQSNLAKIYEQPDPERIMNLIGLTRGVHARSMIAQICCLSDNKLLADRVFDTRKRLPHRAMLLTAHSL